MRKPIKPSVSCLFRTFDEYWYYNGEGCETTKDNLVMVSIPEYEGFEEDWPNHIRNVERLLSDFGEDYAIADSHMEEVNGEKIGRIATNLPLRLIEEQKKLNYEMDFNEGVGSLEVIRYITNEILWRRYDGDLSRCTVENCYNQYGIDKHQLYEFLLDFKAQVDSWIEREFKEEDVDLLSYEERNNYWIDRYPDYCNTNEVWNQYEFCIELERNPFTKFDFMHKK